VKHMQRTRLSGRAKLFALAATVAAVAGSAATAAIATSSSDAPPFPLPTAQKAAAWNNDHQLVPVPDAAPPAAKHPEQAPPVDPPAPPAHNGEVVDAAPDSGLPVPVSPAQFTPTTAWIAQRATLFVHVYAGSVADDRSQGELVVWSVEALTGRDVVARVPFPTPQKLGPLTLTNVDGDIVSFSSPKGAGTFNLITHTFVLH
jgi:hypothetical protein